MKTTLVTSLPRALSLWVENRASSHRTRMDQQGRLRATTSADSDRQASIMVKPTAEPISFSDWLTVINRLVSVSKINWLEVARVVLAAKRKLARGQWTAMWKSPCVPFKKGTADALFAIGKNLGDLNAQTSEHLPRGWTTLQQLSRLDRETLLMLINDGTVHPRITFNEARDLVARFNGRTKKTTRANVIRCLHRFRAFVDTTLNEWTRDERERVQIELSEVIEQINGVGWQTSHPSPDSSSFQNQSPADAHFFPRHESKKSS